MKSFALYLSLAVQVSAVLAAMATPYLPQGGTLDMDLHIYAYAAGLLGSVGLAWRLLISRKPTRSRRLSARIYQGAYHRDMYHADLAPAAAIADQSELRDRARRLFGSH